MIKMLIGIILGCVVIAWVGAMGEKMMHYGREKGIVKKNYEDDEDKPTEKEDKP